MNHLFPFRLLAAGCLIACAAGCASTYSTRSVDKSGFLGDYAQMKEDPRDDVQLIYVRPQVNFLRYRRIVMDPVTVYATQDSHLGKVPKEELKALVDLLDASIRNHLTNRYEFVSAARPQDTLRLRVALTDAQGANVAMDVMSTVVPFGVAASSAKRVILGSHSAIGKAGIEVEILDAETNQRLWALVDQRAGRKVTFKFDKLRKWRTVEDAANYWADIIRRHIEEQAAQQQPAP